MSGASEHVGEQVDESSLFKAIFRDQLNRL